MIETFDQNEDSFYFSYHFGVADSGGLHIYADTASAAREYIRKVNQGERLANSGAMMGGDSKSGSHSGHMNEHAATTLYLTIRSFPTPVMSRKCVT